MKKITHLLIKAYNINPTTIAFLDGIFVSAAINILTGLSTNEGNSKWIALAAALTMLFGAVLMLFWQNSASKLQEHYNPWKEDVILNNETVDQYAQKKHDWVAYIVACSEPSKDPISELPRYSISRLVGIITAICLLILSSIGLMIWSFI